MPDYPPLEGPPPQIFTDEHVRGWEQQLHNLAVANAIISKGERMGITMEQTRRDCDGLCEFFHRALAEERGQQAEHPLPVV